MDPFVVATTFLFLAAGPARAFNLATDKPIWASSDRVSSAADYFSYSMALDPQNSILFVGAPGYETSGAVFKCPFQGSNPNEQTVSCSRIAGEGTTTREE